jgi:hypothetical protein
MSKVESTPDAEQSPDTRHFVLLGETTPGPHREHTRLGHRIEVAPDNYDSEESLLKAAAERIASTMPQSKDQLVDDELRLVEVNPDIHFVQVEDLENY